MTLKFGGTPSTPASFDDLSAEDPADLLANYPDQDGLTEGQLASWFQQSYFLRHLFDDGADSIIFTSPSLVADATERLVLVAWPTPRTAPGAASRSATTCPSVAPARRRPTTS